MLDTAGRLSTSVTEEISGVLDFSCREITLAVPCHESKEGSFHVTGPNGELTEGFVISSSAHMRCLTPFFSGVLDEIGYRFDSGGLTENDTIDGSFLILSNQGEYRIPYHVAIVPETALLVPENVGNLFEFANLARSDWQKAVSLFYTPGFAGILASQDASYRGLYEGLSRQPGNEQNVEEFLLATRKKEKVQYLTSQVKYGPEQTQDRTRLELTITRNGWGYTRLGVQTEGAFLSADKTQLTGADFSDHSCRLGLLLDPKRLHAGLNLGCVILSSPYETIRIPVQMLGRAPKKTGQYAQREQRRLSLLLTRTYLDYRLERIGEETWLRQSSQIVEQQNAADDRNPASRLYQAHLLALERKGKEARWILDHVQVLLKDEGPALRCYYLYLTTLVNPDESYCREVERQVRDTYLLEQNDWRLAWLLLKLSEGSGRSVTQKWLFLEEQFSRGCTSPVLYAEALELMGQNPTLLMKLGDYEMQVLSFAIRQDHLTEDVADQFYYLAAREKECRPALLRALVRCYGKTPSAACLQAICTLLIKGNFTGAEYLPWYRMGVTQELRITKLYEYYMMSVDLDGEEEIPKIALLYFAFRSSLEPARLAYLYQYVLRHRDEYPDLYATYAPQIERFTIRELYQGSISRPMAALYRSVLTGPLLTGDNLAALAKVLFLHEIRARDPSVVKAVLIHEYLRGEQSLPITDGLAYVPLYGERDILLLEDADGNRYAVSKTPKVSELLRPGDFLDGQAELGKRDLGVNLYLCKSLAAGVIPVKEADRYLFLARSAELDPKVRRGLQLRLIRLYDETGRRDELDDYLQTVIYEDTAPADRPELVRFLVKEGMYDKAWQWVRLMGPDRADASILVLLCDRILYETEGEESEELSEAVFSAFSRGKYNISLLEYLLRYFDGSTRDMKRIFRAARRFGIDAYPICARALSQILYTGVRLDDACGEIFETYLAGGAKSEIERAYLDRCAHDYLLFDASLPEYARKDILRCFTRREALGTACGLAVLRYYADKPGEWDGDVRKMLSLCARQLLEAGIRLPFFSAYASLLPQLRLLSQQTMISWRDHKQKRVLIRYRPFGSQREFAEEEMRDMYGGIFAHSFVLFYDEKLEYEILGERDGVTSTLSTGILEKRDSEWDGQGRFGMLNQLERLQKTGTAAEVSQALEDYSHLKSMTEQLFLAR